MSNNEWRTFGEISGQCSAASHVNSASAAASSMSTSFALSVSVFLGQTDVEIVCSNTNEELLPFFPPEDAAAPKSAGMRYVDATFFGR
jgi:hypothetical protein